MIRVAELRLPIGHDRPALDRAVRTRLRLASDAPMSFEIVRRGVDARRRAAIMFVYGVDVTLPTAAAEAELLDRFAADPAVRPTPDTTYRFRPAAAAPHRRPVVVGAGPCGLFAALMLARWGLRPIIVERGQPVRTRTADTWRLWRHGELDPESNAQFGEGGAGTFSDGKLWSGVGDPLHLGRKVLEDMVAAGAPEEILTVAKPHIGTFRLVTIVTRLRATIEALGGEYRFGQRVTGLATEPIGGRRRLVGLHLAGGDTIETGHAILAPGHSARDVFDWLARDGVALAAKPFSIGVRIEHPQAAIDAVRLGPSAGHPALGAADYKLVHHTAGRAVYSFCMCPGGQVVAAASEPGRVVTNGMSQYSRAERNANAGLVVSVTPDDFAPFASGPLAGIAFQRHWESLAFAAGGGAFRAPAQTVGDFLAGRPSRTLGGVLPSYRPGVTATDLAACLPEPVVHALRDGLVAFGRKLPGFDRPDAVLTGVETRTSSPVRILRDERLQSPGLDGLFPAGEGGGFAGGILSAAIDGIRVAEALARALAPAGIPDAA